MFRLIGIIGECVTMVVCTVVSVLLYVPFLTISAIGILLASSVEALFRGGSIVKYADPKLNRVCHAVGIKISFD